MDTDELLANIQTAEPAVGLRAARALHRLAERVEAISVRRARDRGWSWEEIGDALDVSRQSVHKKYSRTEGR
jgi:DNA-directed RNA polymerase specialized sigma24 family protein